MWNVKNYKAAGTKQVVFMPKESMGKEIVRGDNDKEKTFLVVLS